MNRRRRPANPLRLLVLMVLVAGALYINQVVVPATPPLFVPTPTATRSPESFVMDAENLVKEGKIAQAIETYQGAIQADPKNPANHIALAKLLVFTGRYKEAVTSAENALLLNANNSQAHAVRGWGLAYMDEYMLSEAALKEAIRIDPNNAAAYAYYAELIARQTENGSGDLGSLDRAIEYSRTAQSLNPNLLETHRARGIVLEITANYAEAAQEFEAALAIDPNIADLHLALGRNYRQLQDFARAIEEFNKANALNPTDPLPDTYIARTYLQAGEQAKAVQYAEQAVKDAPTDPYMWGNLGSMLYSNAQYSEAITALGLAVHGGKTEEGQEVKGLPLDPGVARILEYYQRFGIALARQGQCGEALQISQALLEGAQSDETAVYNAQEMVNICEQVASGELNPGAEETTGEGEETTSEETTGEETTGEEATSEEGTQPEATTAP